MYSKTSSLTQDDVAEHTIPILDPKFRNGSTGGKERCPEGVVGRTEVNGVVRVDRLECVGAIRQCSASKGSEPVGDSAWI